MKLVTSIVLCILLYSTSSKSQILPTASPRNYCNFSFTPSEEEAKCFEYFNDTASGVNNINAFILAKMTEMMYLERLDYQIRYLQNDCFPVDSIPSSDWLVENAIVNDSNFQQAFVERFQHYFPSPLETIEEHEEHGAEDNADQHIQFKYIQRTYTQDARFLGYKYKQGLDPELMVVSTPDLVLILFRGTDEVKKHKWAEWTGTDFRINQMNAGGALVGTKVHTGFWLSFDLIRDELISTLTEFDAEHKKVWVAGHSLGAALSVLTGVYLKSSGYNVQNVYAYACPRTIGNKAFIKKSKELLPNRIQRFEYYQDPITILWAPGYKYHYVGQRNWYDEAEKGNYKLYKGVKERVFMSGGLKKYPYIDSSLNKKERRRIKRNHVNGITFIGMNMFHYHNPQWYVKAAYHQLTAEEKKRLPLVDDSYPYLYYTKKNTK
ncbi:MAG: lipase family protein [Aureispira sp.]|nr:lipase family protein [Aureispira sp.]